MLSGDIFLVTFPADARPRELGDEVIRGFLMVNAGGLVIPNAEAGARFEPKIVGLTRRNSQGSIIPFRVRRHGQQGVVNVRAIRAAFNLRPIMVFHGDHKYGCDPVKIPSAELRRQKTGEKEKKRNAKGPAS